MIFVMAQSEDDFLLRRKFALGALDRAPRRARHDLALGSGTLVDRLDPALRFTILIRREEADEAAAAKAVARAIDRDARQPRFEFRSPLKLCEMRVSLDEWVLRNRVGFDVVANDREGDTVDFPLKSIDEKAERAAVTAEGSGNEFGVGRGRGVDLRHRKSGDTSHRSWTREVTDCLHDRP